MTYRYLMLSLISGSFALLAAGATQAQFSTPFAGNNDQPIGISADEDIEWNREEKYYIARGNAQASQGDVFIAAQTLQAFYTETGSGGGAATTGSDLLSGAGAGGTQIFKLVADGDVYAKSGEDILIGSRLEYLIQEEQAVITGDLIQLATNQGVVSAREKITYDGIQLFAVAEGNAMVSQDSNIVEADKVTAFFYPENQGTGGNSGAGLPGQGRIRRIEAQGNVKLTDGRSFASAENASYDPDAQMAVLTCNVQVAQGENQMLGDYAEYNFNTGEANVSVRQVAGCQAQSQGRIFILIDPQTGSVNQVRQ